MTYIECRAQQCSFLTTPQDKYCPNCGIPKPLLHTSEDYLTSLVFRPSRHRWLFATASILVFLLASAILLERAADPKVRVVDLSSLFFLAVIIAMSAVWGGFVLLKSVYVKSRQLGVCHNPNLKQIEHIIHQRLSAIKEQEDRVDIVLPRVRQNTGEHWNVAGGRLEGAKVTLKQQRGRYITKLLEIETVRWQNKITSLIEDLDSLTFEQNNSRLEVIDTMREQGVEIRIRLESLQHEFGSTLEMQQLLERLDETLLSCWKIHEALVGRQAVIALEGVAPLKDAVLPTSTPLGTLKSLEAFNSQVAITDFSSSFEELEAEYFRMKSEEELGQQVEQILKRA